MSLTIQAQDLETIAARLLHAAGAPEWEAGQVAAHLVRANLCGHDSHGVQLLGRYVGHIKDGLVKPGARAVLETDRGAVMRFNGQDGFGVVVMDDVMDQAIARAKDQGAAVFAVAHCHHIGRVGRYGEAAAHAGLLGFISANVTDHDPMMAPHGGIEARFGTNPLCVAFPSSPGRDEIVLDMATSAGALGKVVVAHQSGTQLPEGLVIDSQGHPTTDPAAFFGPPQGSLLPFGGHKGFGLALMIELFAGLLSGGGTLQPGNPRRDGLINNVFGLVLDPAAFGDVDWMQTEAEAMLDYVLAAKPQDPNAPVITPGTPEREARLTRMKQGIPIAQGIWTSIEQLAADLGVSVREITST